MTNYRVLKDKGVYILVILPNSCSFLETLHLVPFYFIKSPSRLVEGKHKRCFSWMMGFTNMYSNLSCASPLPLISFSIFADYIWITSISTVNIERVNMDN